MRTIVEQGPGVGAHEAGVIERREILFLGILGGQQHLARLVHDPVAVISDIDRAASLAMAPAPEPEVLALSAQAAAVMLAALRDVQQPAGRVAQRAVEFHVQLAAQAIGGERGGGKPQGHDREADRQRKAQLERARRPHGCPGLLPGR